MSFKSLNYLTLKFLIFNFLILFITRVLIIYSFGNSEIGFNSELFNTIFTGIRFDIKLIATLSLALVYLPYIFLMKYYNYRVLNILLLIFTLFILFICFVDFGHYFYFGRGFDALSFGIVNDGTKEVILSIISDIRLDMMLLVCFVALVLVYRWWGKYYQNIQLAKVSIKLYLYTFLIIIFVVVFARGSFTTFPLSKKTIDNIDNKFLSNVVLAPVWQIYYAYKDLKLSNFSSSHSVLKRCKVQSYDELLDKSGLSNKLMSSTSVDKFLEQNPPNVIFVQMEGWSSHIAIFDSVTNPVLGAFTKHKNSDYFFPRFLSNAYGTNPTIEEILLNSTVGDVSQSVAQRTQFSTFALRPYKAQGYESLFLSGGSSSWRNHNVFWINQGFDIGRATIEKHFDTSCDNSWGVYDELLFDYLQYSLMHKSKKPLFSYVLTTNNHPPVQLPKDFVTPKFDMSKYKYKDSDTIKQKMLQGYYYQSNAFGKFLDWLKTSEFKDNTIVVATGDHALRNFENYKENSMLFFKYAVPLYLYLPPKYDKLSGIDSSLVGSHNDIFPTLYHLSLSGTKYYDFGTPITDKASEQPYGWNDHEVYLFDQGIVDGRSRMFEFDKEYELHPQPINATSKEKQIIKKIYYQNCLKSYILNQEFENQKGNK